MPKIPLLHLVSDLVRDDSLHLRFVREPKTVLDEYDLQDPDRSLFLKMDLAAIAAAVGTHLGNYNPPEMLPDDPDFLAEDGGVDPKYPTPRPGFFRIKPDQIVAAEVNAKPSGSFELLIYGQSFTDADLVLERQSDKKSASLTDFFAFGTFRCTLLRVVVGPVQGEQGFTAGDRFDLTVVNQKGSATGKELVPYPTPIRVV